MKFSIKSSVVYLAGLSSLTITVLAISCVRQDNGLFRYIVKTSNLPNISGVCGGLWDNLKRFSQCFAPATF